MKTLLPITIYCFLLASLLSACSTKDEAPFNLEKLLGKGLVPLPHEQADNWLLAHIDVETTGLLPGYHEMIDIGIVMTDLEGNQKGTYYCKLQPEHPERCSEGARKVNAFDPEKWEEQGALSPSMAVDSIFNFHQRVAGEKNVLMVAYNSHFDLSFLDHLLRSQQRSWRELYHYFVLDIPSMAWSLGYRDLTGQQFMQKFGIEDEPHVAEKHTGITGAMKNARIYRSLVEAINQ